MRKFYTIVTGITGIFLTFLFTSCNQFTANIEEYLEYWSTEAAITRYSFDPAITVHADKDTIESIPSLRDVTVTLTVRNPKNVKFQLPQDAGAPADIVVFPADVEGTTTSAPKQPDDYELTQDSPSQLTLKYKAVFLQKHEYGKKNIGPTITLYPEDGRKFSKTFTLNVKANTPPPKPTFAVAKTTGTPSYYVLCITVPETDMSKTVAGGLLHKDLAHVEINETPYAFSVNEAEKKFVKPESDSFITLSDVTKLTAPDADEIPTGGWVLYYKTDVEVKDGAAKKDYTIRLADAEGLVSGALKASTKPNRPAPVQISLVKGSSTADVNSDNTKTHPHTIRVDEEHKPATLRLTCATANTTVYYTLTETTTGSSASPLTASGAGSGVDISLPIQTGRTEAEYTLTVRAEADGFETGAERTLYYKITTQSTVTDLPVLNSLAFSSGSTSVQFSNAADTEDEVFSSGTTEYYIFAAQLSPPSMSFTYTSEPDATVTVKVNGTAHTGTMVTLPTVGGETLVTFTVEKAGLQNEYKVHIKRKSYTVTFTAKSSDDESAAGGGTINVTNPTAAGIGSVSNNNSAAVTVKAEIGATITATATAASGYTFIKWSGISVTSQTNVNLSYVVGSNAEIKAEFKSPNIYVRGTNGDWYNGIPGAAEGNDSTGTGSKQKPYKTVSNALSQCTATGTAYTIFVDGTIEENTTLDIASGKKVTIESLRKDTPAVTAVIHDNRPAPSDYQYLVKTAGTLTLDSVILKANITGTHVGNSVYVYGIQQTAGTVTVKGNTTEIRNFGHGVKIEGGTFTMENGSICNNYVNGAGSAGVEIGGGGTFKLTGGSIKNNEATSMAGVYVKGSSATNQGIFKMESGEISGNKAKCLGGGIYVGEHGQADISGGTITANHAAKSTYFGGNKDVGGGGIYVEKGTVNFTAGTIEENIIYEVEKNCGAGVLIGEQGTFNMSGGTIKDCTTQSSAFRPSRGIGVYVAGGTSASKGTFNMTGGTIENCKPLAAHAADGGGVYVGAGAVFTMKGYADVTPSTGSDANGKGNNDVYLANGTKITIAEKLEYQHVARITPESYPTSFNPNIQVIQNPASNTTNVAENWFKFTVTSDSNTAYCVNEAGLIRQQVDTSSAYGQTDNNWAKLKAAIESAATNTVIYVRDVCYTWNTTDTITVDNKTITLIGLTSGHVSLVANQKCRIFTIKNGGKLTIKNMELEKGQASDGKGGGGILLENDGNPTSLTLENVSITSCYTSGYGTRHGAGIAIYNGTVTMKGKTQISGCETTAADGGGVYIGSGGTLTIDGYNTTNHNDKTYIRFCKASKGGGVYIASGGKLELKQGQLSFNRATGTAKKGYAVYNENTASNSFNWSGGAIKYHYVGSGGSVIEGPCNNTSGNTAD